MTYQKNDKPTVSQAQQWDFEKKQTGGWRKEANKGPARVKDVLLFKGAADWAWILTSPPFSEM